MAIVKDYLDPNAQVYSDDEIVGKVNTAAVNISRAGSVEAAASPIVSGEVGAAELAAEEFTTAEQSKLTGIDDGAKVDQTGEEIRDAVVALADDDREIVISRPVTDQFKVYAIQRHSDGKTELERSDTAEV